jgi:hypothetical protein
MNNQTDVIKGKLSDDFNEAETEGKLSEVKRSRRQFVEPEVSTAIKVLKATQFFQQFSDNGVIS